MFNKLFNRTKATPVVPAPTAPVAAAPVAPEPVPPVLVAPVSKESRLEAFREEWDNRWESAHEVIEGNGGNTDWGTWTDAVEKEEQSFAPTVAMPLGPK
jgi:hypothetical protein